MFFSSLVVCLRRQYLEVMLGKSSQTERDVLVDPDAFWNDQYAAAGILSPE